jgi:CHAD domain-containing protein
MNAVTYIKRQIVSIEKASSHFDSQSVHLIRVNVKRLRALVQLIEKIDPLLYQNLDKNLKQAGRRLSLYRDRQISTSWMISHTKSRHGSILKIPFRDIGLSARQIVSLKGDLIRVGQIIDRSPDQMGQSLRRGYEIFKKARKKAEKTGKASKFHKWRRRSKDLLYVMDATLPKGDRRSKKFVSRITELGKILGDLHDLSVVRKVVDNKKPYAQNSKLLKKIDTQIDSNKMHALRSARHMSPPGVLKS